MANSAYFVKSTPPEPSVYPLIHCSYVTDILKMYMKKLNCETIVVFYKFTALFNFANFQPLHIWNNG